MAGTTRIVEYFLLVVLLSSFHSANAVYGFVVRTSGFSNPSKNRAVLPLMRGGSSAVSSATSSFISSATSTLNYNATAADPGSIPLQELWSILQSSPGGISNQDAQERLDNIFGPNKLQEAPSKTTWQLIKEQFEDRLVQILLVVAVMSAVFSFFEMAKEEHIVEGAVWKALVEPLVITAILVLNAAVGVWQSKSAEGSLEALKKLQPSLTSVLRDSDGWQDEMDASQLVPGDVISMRVGDKIPADARLFEASGAFVVDEASLTGESTTVEKIPGDEGTVPPNLPVQDQKGMVYSGTMVTRGSGVAVVVKTGMDTEIGKIQKGVTQAKSEEGKTPLAEKLDEFGNTLTAIIGFICCIVWIASIPNFSDPGFSSVWDGAIYYAKVAVALGVAAIPEGLPAVITLCLSLGTRRMAQRNVIVRNLRSVETLGCTSVICTDKTGTLTTNEMTAVSLVLLERESVAGSHGTVMGGRLIEHPINGVSYSPVGRVEGIETDVEIKAVPNGAVADVAAVSALCNDAKIVGNDEFAVDDDGEDIVNEDGSIQYAHKSKEPKKNGIIKNEKAYERVGEPTEGALCVLAEKLGGMSHYLEGRLIDNRGLHINVAPSILASANVNSWRTVHPRSATLEFNRDRKSMSVLCQFPPVETYDDDIDAENPDEMSGIHNRLLVKGAPNLLIDRCTHVKCRDGTVVRLSGELKRAIEAKTSELAKRPLRCLALAVKEVEQLDRSLKHYDGSTSNPLLSDPSNFADIESGLTLVGIVGIKDPARPEVAESIKECSGAGIRIVMITGDAKDTAIAIAKDVNIFPKKAKKENIKAYEGREFFEKSNAEQLELLKSDNIVFCRAEPADKQKLVRMLQGLGEIAGMTGDGVNDAPALQQAAIGIAMGVTGTDVSKEAADMVLADDNFSTIVAAVEEGRCIYANMQAFICFLISCNIGEICAILLATLGGFPEPLTAMHLLWVNLVTDGPPATALGFNPASPDLMAQKPRPKDEPIMTKWLLTRYCLTGLYVGLATVGIFIGHYLSMGVTIDELAEWSKCGDVWTPSSGMCTDLFQGTGRLLPQTLSLTTLVCMEMLKALSAVSVDNSLLSIGPQENPWLILGVTVPFLLHLAVVYSSNLGFPILGDSFGLVPLSWENWQSVLLWSMPILVVDEVLKYIGRQINRKVAEEREAAAAMS